MRAYRVVAKYYNKENEIIKSVDAAEFANAAEAMSAVSFADVATGLCSVLGAEAVEFLSIAGERDEIGGFTAQSVLTSTRVEIAGKEIKHNYK